MGFGRYRRGVGMYLGGVPQWFIELLGAGGNAAPVENENWIATGW